MRFSRLHLHWMPERCSRLVTPLFSFALIQSTTELALASHSVHGRHLCVFVQMCSLSHTCSASLEQDSNIFGSHTRIGVQSARSPRTRIQLRCQKEHCASLGTKIFLFAFPRGPFCSVSVPMWAIAPASQSRLRQVRRFRPQVGQNVSFAS